MRVDRITVEHIQVWAEMRALLWPEYSIEQHMADGTRLYLSGDDRTAAFICRARKGVFTGFAETTLRRDFVNGCNTSPVVFMEGIFVQPDYRRKGAARLLCRAVADWGISMGCREFASDAYLEDADSHSFHSAVGFEETERVVFFRKALAGY